MKSVLKIGVAAWGLFIFTSAHAQVRDTISRLTPPKNGESDAMASEYVFIRNEVVIMHKRGNDVGLPFLYTCTDGSTVSTDGTLTRKDGTKMKLKEGDKVYSDGRLDVK